MKALQKVRPARGLELRDVARPGEPGHGEVIVEVRATGLCGTDLHIFEWTPGYEAMTAIHAGHAGSRVLRDDRGARPRGAWDRRRHARRGTAVGGVWALRDVRGRRLRRLHEAQGDRRHARWRTGQAGQRSRGRTASSFPRASMRTLPHSRSR